MSRYYETNQELYTETTKQNGARNASYSEWLHGNNSWITLPLQQPGTYKAGKTLPVEAIASVRLEISMRGNVSMRTRIIVWGEQNNWMFTNPNAQCTNMTTWPSQTLGG
jgi:hypothetical protein